MSKDKSQEHDLERILRRRDLRPNSPEEPFAQHFSDFVEFRREEADHASELVKRIINRYAVIALVTGMEILFRDYFSHILHECDPSGFDMHLAKWQKRKYGIDELLNFERQSIPVSELIIDGINFQNLDEIASVFRGLLGVESFWEGAFKCPRKMKDGTEQCPDSDSLVSLKYFIDFRHRLIHHPDEIVPDVLEAERERYDDAIMLLISTVDVFETFIETHPKPIVPPERPIEDILKELFPEKEGP